MMLVIGCGNLDRGDDAAGLLVARRLQELGIPAIEAGGGGLELMDLWSASDEVAVIDAVITGSKPGALFHWNGKSTPFCPVTFCCSTHAFGVGEAVQLGQILGNLPEKLTIYGIEGAEFEPGSKPGPAVLRGVEAIAAEIAESFRLLERAQLVMA